MTFQEKTSFYFSFFASDGRTAEEFARELLGFPEHLHLEAVLALGMPESHPAPAELDALAWAKVHSERF